MARFDRGYRQKVIDGYLNASGRNVFIPAEFLAWLRDQPDHQAYPIFFSKSDEDAADEWRIDQVRKFVSGLRISVRVHVAQIEDSSREIRVTEAPATSVRMPAFFSPASERKGGGGYYPTDVDDPAVRRELRRQAATELRRFIHRHEGIARISGISLDAIKAIAAAFDAQATEEAA